MLEKRIIPCLLLKGNGLVKSIKFKNHNYIGDPINTARIFNEKEVDEMVFLDITATTENRTPNFKLISELAFVLFRLILCRKISYYLFVFLFFQIFVYLQYSTLE